MDQIRKFILTIGITPKDDPDTRTIKQLMPRNLLVFIPLFLGFGAIHLYFHEPLAGAFYIGAGLFSLINFLIYATMHKNIRITNPLQGVVSMATFFAATVALGGIFNSGGVYLWGIFVAMMALMGLSFKQARNVLILFIAGFLLIIFMEPYLRQTNNLPRPLILFLIAFTIISLSISIFRNLAYYIDQHNKEKEKVEQLLLNVLPKDIADILKDEQRVIADQFNTASILFADVVNFTPMSSQMTATELVALLNEVFSYFDTLVEKYGLEKIKTVGDCYMVASGVPKPRSDHAKILASMALDIRSYTTSQTFQGKQLSFRIGINSGPVVAGVIGRKKFIYDLWGDTVNTASRMESHSLKNVIQITKETYELLKDDFDCSPQGIINVKGKGEMEVWHLIDKKG